MTLDTIIEYVQSATTVYRKGDVVTQQQEGGMRVVTVDAFPELPPGSKVVDCHFVWVGFTEAFTTMTADELYQAITDTEAGMFRSMGPQSWANGPSYIEIGGWIGDQTLAFQFMACCVAHGLANHVITPTLLGFDETQADQLAGAGLVLLSPLTNPKGTNE